MVSKLQNFLKNSIEIIFIFLISVVCVVAVISAVKMSSVISIIAIVPSICLLFLFYKYKSKSEHKLKINYRTLWLVVRILCIILMTIVCFALEVPINGDWRVLLQSAYNYTVDYSLTKNELIYLARYPNNRACECMLIFIIKISSKFISDITIDQFKRITMGVAIVFTQVTIEMIYRSAVLLWNKERAFYVSLFSMMFIPLYQYSGILYTDVPGCCLASVAFYFYLLIENSNKQKNRIILSVFFGLFFALAFMMKFTSAILLIAIIICLFIRKHNIKIKQLICVTLVFIVSLGIFYTLINNAEVKYFDENLGITDEMKDKYEFPFTHWVMMGLGNGNYSQDDCNYTMNLKTKELKIFGNKLKIQERLESRTFSEFMKHLYNKIRLTFQSPFFNGDDYTGRNSVRINIFNRLLTNTGDLYKYGKYYSFIFYFVILFGMIASAVFSVINKFKNNSNDKLLIARLTVVGIILYNLLSECNPRYIIIFLPLFLIICCDGYLCFFKCINNALNKKNKV